MDILRVRNMSLAMEGQSKIKKVHTEWSIFSINLLIVILIDGEIYYGIPLGFQRYMFRWIVGIIIS